MTRVRLIVTIVVLAVVAPFAVWFTLAWRGRGAEPASVEEALEEFRRAPAAADGVRGFLLPAPGVYTYRADGVEHLSFLDTTQRWGATIPATVTHEGGCWRLRLSYSTNHWQEWELCPADSRLEEVAGGTFQSFDFVAFTASDTVAFTCDPPGVVLRTDVEPGASWRQSCRGISEERGTETTSSGANTFVGIERVEVGDEAVEAYRYRHDREIRGDQTGVERFETWYATRDGMLLRGTRDIEVRSPSPIGDVTYTERGTFELTSLVPRR